MKKDINNQGLIGNLIVQIIIFLIGVIISLIGFLHPKLSVAWKTILSTIGLAFISGIILAFISTIVNYKIEAEKLKKDDEQRGLQEWGIRKIYEKRGEINSRQDAKGMMTLCMEKLSSQYDIIAYGLTRFRRERTDEVKKKLRTYNNLKFRFLIPDPNLEWLKIKDQLATRTEQGVVRDTSKEIESLLDWIKELSQEFGDRVQCKLYNCLPQDFYCRVDNIIFIGPQLIGFDSNDTITYVYNVNGKCGTIYTNYFEHLWENERITTPLKRFLELKGAQNNKNNKRRKK